MPRMALFAIIVLGTCCFGALLVIRKFRRPTRRERPSLDELSNLDRERLTLPGKEEYDPIHGRT